MKSKIKILFHYILRYKTGYLIGFLALIITDVFWLLRPKIIGNAVDSLIDTNPSHSLHWFVGVFIAVAIAENLFRVFWRVMLIGSSRHIERDFLNDYFAHLLKLDARFYDRTPTGDLMARATNDMSSVRMLLGPGMMALFDAFVVFAMTLFFMVSINMELTLYAMLPFFLVALFLAFLMRKVFLYYDAVQEQFSTISARAQENISGIRVIKSHNREDYEINEFDKVTRDYIRKFMRLTKFESGIEPVIQFIAGIGVVVTLFLGGNAVIEGKMTLGELVQFFFYLMTMVWPVIAIGWSSTLFERGFASLGRLENIFNEKSNVEQLPEEQSSKFSHGNIEFRNVSFRFKDDAPDVLKNINLEIPKGTTLGVVGHLGSGKSALVGLIPRLYVPTSGEIFVSGINIKNLSLSGLRSEIGIVPQEPFLFSRNISDNIRLGRLDEPRSEENVKRSLEIAEVFGEIDDFPDKIDTMLGERGVRLSGGQKQRMTIARALDRNPSILILDDALSSVDTNTEESILNNLKEFMKGRTNIIVSHRISTIKKADLIVVLSEGEIIEKGTHLELVAKNGFYTRLYNQQQLQQEIEKED